MKRQFDAKLWETGNATVVTIPSPVIKKLKLKKGEIVLITLEKDDEKKIN